MNKELLAAIKTRAEKGQLKTPFGQGIITADRYVKTVLDCVGSDACYKYASKGQTSFDDVLRKASETLVYRNEDMILESEPVRASNVSEMKQLLTLGDVEVELPKNCLMAFKHVLTTPRKDRDRDVLRTEGAIPDPKMLLLWQHIHTLPIGKMLLIAEHTSQKLSLVSAIVDMNELAHDAAVMVDNDMARFSHGFRALEFEQLKAEEGEEDWQCGFDVKRFEIMEESVVSVPSNVDAEVEGVIIGLAESGKLTSGLMKEHAKQLREKMPARVAVTRQMGDYSETVEADSAKNLKEALGVLDEERKPGQKTGCGEGCGCSGNGSRASGQEDGNAEGEAEGKKNAENDQMKSTCFYPGQIKNSWESIEQQLDKQARNFFQGRDDVPDSERRYFWRTATFSDAVIFCAEHYESGHEKEFLYLKCGWKMADEGARLEGDPEAVDLEISIESAAERSPHTEEKSGKETSPVKAAIGILLTQGSESELKQLAGLIQQQQEQAKKASKNAALRKLLKS